MKQRAKSHIPYAVLTDRGLTRGHNEDWLNITAFESENPLVAESLLCVLCDGVGGHQAGETASEMAATNISAYIENSDGLSPVVQLTNAIQSASRTVFEASQSSPALRGMASTAAVAWIIGNRLFTANVGDSRIYLIKNQHIHQLSTDHTWLQEALKAGLINKEETKNHPNAHMISRFVGSEFPPEVDVRLNLDGNNDQNMQGMLLESMDIVFLCSDGVSDLVQESEILDILTKHSLEESLEILKQVVYQRGAYDNLTMIAAQMPAVKKPVSKWKKRLRLLGFTLILLAAAAIGLFLGWYALHNFVPRVSP